MRLKREGMAKVQPCGEAEPYIDLAEENAKLREEIFVLRRDNENLRRQVAATIVGVQALEQQRVSAFLPDPPPVLYGPGTVTTDTTATEQIRRDSDGVTGQGGQIDTSNETFRSMMNQSIITTDFLEAGRRMLEDRQRRLMEQAVVGVDYASIEERVLSSILGDPMAWGGVSATSGTTNDE